MFFSVGYRGLIGDPSYSPSGVDYFSGAISIAGYGGFKMIGKTIKTGYNAFKYTSYAFSGITSIPQLFIDGKQFNNLSRDDIIFNLAIKTTVLYNGKRYKFASYATKKIFLEKQGIFVGDGIDETQLILNPKLYKALDEAGENPAEFFSNGLEYMGDSQKKGYQDWWNDYNPKYR